MLTHPRAGKPQTRPDRGLLLRLTSVHSRGFVHKSYQFITSLSSDDLRKSRHFPFRSRYPRQRNSRHSTITGIPISGRGEIVEFVSSDLSEYRSRLTAEAS